MKFTIKRDYFIAALQYVLNVITTRPSSMPILNNVLIEADDNRLRLTTTNLDIGVEVSVKANVEIKGRITLPGRRLLAIIKALSEDIVQIDEVSETQVKIVSGNSQFKIMGIPSKDFPALPDINGPLFLELGQKELATMLRDVAYAMSMDEARYVLNGVYMFLEAKKLSVIATDGRRLAIIERAGEIVKDFADQGFIVPAKTVVEFQRLAGIGDAVHMGFNGRHVAAEFDISPENAEKMGLIDSIYLISKVVEGQFPKYRQVIPKDTEFRIKMDRELLLTSIQRCALVVSEKNHSISLKLSENTLEILGSSSEFGDCHERLAIDYRGPETQMAFNPQFLIDPLKALTQDTITFEFKDKLSPGVFRTSDNFLCVIMPLRTT